MNVFVDARATHSFAESGPHLKLNTAGLFDNVVEDYSITARRVADAEQGIRGASHVIWNSTINYEDGVTPRLTIETNDQTYVLIPSDDTYSTLADSESHGDGARLAASVPIRRRSVNSAAITKVSRIGTRLRPKE